jgi:hypothetical protein
VTDGRAYVGVFEDRSDPDWKDYGAVQILSLASPANPTELGCVEMPDSVDDIEVRGQTAYVAANNMGLQIIDVSDPATAGIIGSYEEGYGGGAMAFLGIAVQEPYVYVADHWNKGFLIIDAANLKAPDDVGMATVANYAYDVQVDGDLAYVLIGVGGAILRPLCRLRCKRQVEPTGVAVYRDSRTRFSVCAGRWHRLCGGDRFAAFLR